MPDFTATWGGLGVADPAVFALGHSVGGGATLTTTVVPLTGSPLSGTALVPVTAVTWTPTAGRYLVTGQATVTNQETTYANAVQVYISTQADPTAEEGGADALSYAESTVVKQADVGGFAPEQTIVLPPVLIVADGSTTYYLRVWSHSSITIEPQNAPSGLNTGPATALIAHQWA